MPRLFECDVLVVGAGPAGSCAAAAAAREGVKTILIDAKVRIGEPSHCAGFAPRQLFVEFGFDRASVLQTVEAMESLVVEWPDIAAALDGASEVEELLTWRESSAGRWGGEPQSSILIRRTIPAPGYIIDRSRFDRDLAREATRVGATVLCAARVAAREDGCWIVRRREEEFLIRPRWVIAADGADSSVARILGLGQSDLLVGVQVEVPLAAPLRNTVVVLARELEGGYGWLFPKGSSANVGLAVEPRGRFAPRALLLRFQTWLKALGLIRPGILAHYSGLIPVSGVRERLVMKAPSAKRPHRPAMVRAAAGAAQVADERSTGGLAKCEKFLVDGGGEAFFYKKGPPRKYFHTNVIFCGDAAGLTHPITGAGVAQAVISGCKAGHAAALACRTGTSDPADEYEHDVRAHFAGVLRHAQKKREVLRSEWDRGDFLGLCDRTWIAFKGYSKRVREGC
jgi:flavin-dependent dehydrogenase